MAKDRGTIVLGIIYCSIIGICWLLMFSTIYYGNHLYDLIYLLSPGGRLATFGNCFLIVSFIFYMIFFCSTEGGRSASVGFGLGMPGWIIGIIGSFINYYSVYYYSSIPIATILLIFYITLIVLGAILFARRNKWKS